MGRAVIWGRCRIDINVLKTHTLNVLAHLMLGATSQIRIAIMEVSDISQYSLVAKVLRTVKDLFVRISEIIVTDQDLTAGYWYHIGAIQKVVQQLCDYCLHEHGNFGVLKIGNSAMQRECLQQNSIHHEEAFLSILDLPRAPKSKNSRHKQLSSIFSCASSSPSLVSLIIDFFFKS